MPKSLVIVESDAKARTINRFLGKDYVVRASVGHIKNLPKNRIGVDIENGFEPEYITIRGRGKLLAELKKLASSSDRVFLATDPDREGEAIAQHLSDEIVKSNSNIQRVLFHEITQKAVQEAIEHAHEIDTVRVEAQKARRVMDRLVGYKVSPFLWKTIYRGLSAGRVQSVALRMICEREDEIKSFTAREYWSIEANLKTTGGESVHSRLVKLHGEDVDIPSEVEANRHLNAIRKEPFQVASLVTKTIERKPFAPYTTSTLQQEAVRRLGLTTKQVMAVAQQLYEGVDLPEGRVGLISYMRTDSLRVSESAVEEARQLIAEDYGLEYVPKTPRKYKNKKSAQDAHEAIRPTSLKRPPKKVASSLNANQKKLYELIWNRFVASQMESARIRQSTLDVNAGEYLFRSTGSAIEFKGFMQIYMPDQDEEIQDNFPKSLKKGDSLTLNELVPGQHFTKPPARYNESSLVRELDRLGIGRPSTYALIISTLLDRKYMEKQGRALIPTDLGMTVTEILVKQFPDLFNVGFTAEMEGMLDLIESGEKDRLTVMNGFYHPFLKSVEQAMDKKEEIREALQEDAEDKCPKCGKDLVIKWGRNGKFIACSGYPDCKFTKPVEETTETVQDLCETCGAPMVVKTGRFGRFLACSKYPDCKFTKPFSTGVPCPESGCGGQIVERRSGRGKVFYGCSKYPNCKFASWYKPIRQACPNCGHGYVELRSTKAKGQHMRCPKCKHEIAIEE
jgi:DNA topoisomerase-1